MRPIDADELKSQFLKNYNTLTNIIREQNTNSAIISVSEFIGNTINSVPTAEVQEVRHASWIKDERQRRDDGEIYDYCCSLCRGAASKGEYDNYDVFTDFCPHCGAKMDDDSAINSIYNCQTCNLCCDGCEMYEGAKMGGK